MQFSIPKKTLLRLLADGRFHSGAKLARLLGLSRTAVWSLIHEFKALGLEVSAVPGRGYRLSRSIELLSEAEIRAQLSESAQSHLTGLEIHDELDSTNTRLVLLSHQGATTGSVCLSEYQSAGRGRIGRVWQTPFGGNICVSLLWHFEDHSGIAGLSLAVGVALMRALRLAGVEGAGLKWPNDVLWKGRKLAGILIEVSGEAHGRHAVVIGVGVNLYIPPGCGHSIDQGWTDLTQITKGAPPSRNRLIALMLDELLTLLRNYGRKGLPAYLSEWRDHHCFEGQMVILHQGDRQIRGRVAGVNEDGLLFLDCEGGARRMFASGDVRLRPDAT